MDEVMRISFVIIGWLENAVGFFYPKLLISIMEIEENRLSIKYKR